MYSHYISCVRNHVKLSLRDNFRKNMESILRFPQSKNCLSRANRNHSGCRTYSNVSGGDLSRTKVPALYEGENFFGLIPRISHLALKIPRISHLVLFIFLDGVSVKTVIFSVSMESQFFSEIRETLDFMKLASSVCLDIAS